VVIHIKVFTVFTFIAALTLIAGCSSVEEKIPSESTGEFEENGQSFKIVPL
jgi:outer membrane murein-binding lipoprotein Lpp